MKKKNTYEKVLFIVNNYIVFFALVAFVTTCCMMLFINVLADTLQLTLTEENINMAAKLTFGNVVLLSFIFTLIDVVRRKITVERPVKRITDATEKMMQGDFSVRIKPISRFGTDAKFNEIIDVSVAPGKTKMLAFILNIPMIIAIIIMLVITSWFVSTGG